MFPKLSQLPSPTPFLDTSFKASSASMLDGWKWSRRAKQPQERKAKNERRPSNWCTAYRRAGV